MPSLRNFSPTHLYARRNQSSSQISIRPALASVSPYRMRAFHTIVILPTKAQEAPESPSELSFGTSIQGGTACIYF